MVLKRIEGQLAFDFASKAKLCGFDLTVDRPVELLSAMQHFGAPTRLLDWTYSAYVGLYFALERSLAYEDAAVWAINLTALHARATRSVLPVEKLTDGRRLIPPIRVIDFSRDDMFKKHVLPDLDSYHRTHLLGEPKLQILVPILPGAQNARLAAQQGIFLCASQIGTSFLDQAAHLMRGVKSEWIVKFVVSRRMREDALKRLLQMNVHPLTLFPGPDGLGRFCMLKAELYGWE